METVNNVNETANIRKLATIARISKIEEIEGSDNLELAFVRGWRVVVKKGEFTKGSLCVYIEVDSVLPDGLPVILQIEWKDLQKALSKVKTDGEKDAIKLRMAEISKLNTRPEFEFLREKKFRIKTREIFQTLSQGICFPLSILPLELQWHINELETSRLMPVIGRTDTVEGMDVTDVLGVTQYVMSDKNGLEGIELGDLASVGILVSDEERCLAGDVLVFTRSGNKSIEDIYDEDYMGEVLSYNIANDTYEWKNILNMRILPDNGDWYEITLENGDTIIATSNHKFYLPDLNCFRELKDLNVNDILLISDIAATSKIGITIDRNINDKLTCGNYNKFIA